MKAKKNEGKKEERLKERKKNETKQLQYLYALYGSKSFRFLNGKEMFSPNISRKRKENNISVKSNLMPERKQNKQKY